MDGEGRPGTGTVLCGGGCCLGDGRGSDIGFGLGLLLVGGGLRGVRTADAPYGTGGGRKRNGGGVYRGCDGGDLVGGSLRLAGEGLGELGTGRGIDCGLRCTGGLIRVAGFEFGFGEGGMGEGANNERGGFRGLVAWRELGGRLIGENESELGLEMEVGS